MPTFLKSKTSVNVTVYNLFIDSHFKSELYSGKKLAVWKVATFLLDEIFPAFIRGLHGCCPVTWSSKTILKFDTFGDKTRTRLPRHMVLLLTRENYTLETQEKSSSAFLWDSTLIGNKQKTTHWEKGKLSVSLNVIEWHPLSVVLSHATFSFSPDFSISVDSEQKPVLFHKCL